MTRRKKVKIKGTIDAETDPFVYPRIPWPFVWGLYVNDEFKYFWGKHCTRDLVEYLRSLPEVTLYAHNGGNFDFHYLVKYINFGEIMLINGRIAKMHIGNVTLVDSYLLMPFALAEYKKTAIDYKKFEYDVRDNHKPEILRYLKDDCLDLLNLVNGFHEVLGDHLTIGAAAFAQMKLLGIKITRGNEAHDERYRKYFFGGRTQAFEVGVFKENFEYLDINSAYANAMCQQHPHGYKYTVSSRLPRRKLSCEFVHFTGKSLGALPVRDPDTKLLDFPVDFQSREYRTTGWELQAGLDTKTIIIEKIHSVHTPNKTQSLKPFIDKFFPLKASAKAADNIIDYLAYKYCTNSGFGKYATDPRKFKKHIILPYDGYSDEHGWDFDIYGMSVWSASAYVGRGFFDVAVGASITGFNRAYLWRALQHVKRPMYSDTDSIICKSFDKTKIPISAKLGEWEIEAKIGKLAIAGKKLYTFQSREKGKKVKTVSKGARLTEKEIISVAKGNAVTWQNDAPNFSLQYGARFTEREIIRKLRITENE